MLWNNYGKMWLNFSKKFILPYNDTTFLRLCNFTWSNSLLYNVNIIMPIQQKRSQMSCYQTVDTTRSPYFLNIRVNLDWIIYDDRVQNRKKYFEIVAFLKFEWGSSRAVNSNENQNTTKLVSVAGKWFINIFGL